MYKTYADLRDKAGLKDSDVARELEIAPATLSDWKTGKYLPKVDKLIKIARLFGVTVEYLVEGE